MLDKRFEDRLPHPLRSRVLVVAAGNPLFAVELAAAQAVPGHRLEDRLAMPTRLEEVLTGRVGQLPAVAAEPLAAVASLAAPTVALVGGRGGAAAVRPSAARHRRVEPAAAVYWRHQTRAGGHPKRVDR